MANTQWRIQGGGGQIKIPPWDPKINESYPPLITLLQIQRTKYLFYWLFQLFVPRCSFLLEEFIPLSDKSRRWSTLPGGPETDYLYLIVAIRFVEKCWIVILWSKIFEMGQLFNYLNMRTCIMEFWFRSLRITTVILLKVLYL